MAVKKVTYHLTEEVVDLTEDQAAALAMAAMQQLRRRKALIGAARGYWVYFHSSGAPAPTAGFLKRRGLIRTGFMNEGLADPENTLVLTHRGRLAMRTNKVWRTTSLAVIYHSKES